MSVTSTVSGIYEYNGSLASIGLGSILDTSLLNVGGGPLAGTFVDNNGQLSQADDGQTTFALTGGSAGQIDYLGSGTISALGFLGIKVDPRPVAVFVVNGQIYFYAPQGLPLLSGLTFSLDVDANATFTLPAAADGKVDGLDTAETMNVGYTDLQGDRITENADSVFGNGGNDTINAGGGNDTVFGGSGNDSLLGFTGDDRLHGDDGNDTLIGGIGNDTLFGGSGADRLDGGDGNDSLVGGGGADLLFGGAGNDTLVIDSAGTVQASGGDDRDLIVLRNGLLSASSTIDGGEGGDDLDTLDLRDAGPRRIVYDSTNRENGQILWLNPDGSETGQSTTFTNIEKVICFASGTRITTMGGTCAVEDLSVGDYVLTYDHGYRPIRWIGSRLLSSREVVANDLLRPIVIRAGALGYGLPERDLTLSRQHRILVKSRVAERMFGQREMLVPAKDLRGLAGVDTAENVQSVEYWHILFDDHEVILSENAPTESFFFGPQARGMISAEAYEEIESLFPGMESVTKSLARNETRGQKARRFVERITCNGKLVIESDAGASACMQAAQA
ncbi:Hint domain-containing protein [Pseudotabrizicola algicola]|uniref:Type I secretion protein n=1 Tax=Pseudotabrizicola algicola TaxID=2709381 RepID=A0A6B3RK45_9RHOB|nr:Hint domain-containing protein [Pseudotabrizicola algicola]NEX44805.1 type I secretion protein [Pseudotabrizicola algicola]